MYFSDCYYNKNNNHCLLFRGLIHYYYNIFVSGPMKVRLSIFSGRESLNWLLTCLLSLLSQSQIPNSLQGRPQFLVRGYKLSSREKDVLQRKAKSFFLIIKWTGAGQSRGQSNLFYGQLLSLYYFPSVQSLRSVRRNFIWRFWYFAVSSQLLGQLFPLTKTK